jgi:hypothetical protein
MDSCIECMSVILHLDACRRSYRVMISSRHRDIAHHLTQLLQIKLESAEPLELLINGSGNSKSNASLHSPT